MSTISIKLEISDANGEGSKFYEDNVNPSMIIRDLKKKWSDQFNVGIQSVIFNNQILSEDQNCHFYNIRTGSNVQLILDKSNDQISLVVELQSVNPNQRSTQVRVNPSIKTEELMSAIRNKISFNLESAYLTHHGQQLRSGVSLRDQNIKNNDKIQVLMRTRGG